jgi:hypothetical protein
MSVVELLRSAAAKEVILSPDGENLRFTAPPSALTPELRRELSAHKPAVLAYLRKTATHDIHGADLLAEDYETVVTEILLPADKTAGKLQRSLFEEEPEVGLVGIEAQGPVRICWACGKDAWWTKTCGERVCGVCHPSPVVSNKDATST